MNVNSSERPFNVSHEVEDEQFLRFLLLLVGVVRDERAEQRRDESSAEARREQSRGEARAEQR